MAENPRPKLGAITDKEGDGSWFPVTDDGAPAPHRSGLRYASDRANVKPCRSSAVNSERRASFDTGRSKKADKEQHQR